MFDSFLSSYRHTLYLIVVLLQELIMFSPQVTSLLYVHRFIMMSPLRNYQSFQNFGDNLKRFLIDLRFVLVKEL